MSCPDAFNCLYIEKRNNGTYISACCLMNPWKVDKIDFVNDRNLTKIRNQWNSGQWPRECLTCKISEDNGNTSRRIGAIEWSISNNTEHLNSTVDSPKITADVQSTKLKSLLAGLKTT